MASLWLVKHMGYPPRRILPGHLYEITARAFQARYFFVPNRKLNRYIIGAIAKGLEKYDVKMCITSWMSNHAHSLIEAGDSTQYRLFIQFVHEQVAKEVQRFCRKHKVNWTGCVFARRPSVIEIEGGPDIQRERLKYVLAQGVKEGLVAHPSDWPGVNCAKALLSKKMQLEGVWVDRSSLYEVERGHRRKKKVSRKRLTHKEIAKHYQKITLQLTPMPYQREMTDAERRADIRDIIKEILEEEKEKVAVAKRYRKQRNRRIMDLSKLSLQPDGAKKDVIPLVHADGYGNPEDHGWQLWMLEWELWLNAYERASKRWRRGIRRALAEFPEGCFIPSPPQTAIAALPPP